MNPYPTLPKMWRKVFPPLGRCMYCGVTENLTSEHIVPFALGGEVELPASSCKDCAAVTSRFERTLLRGQLWRARLALGFRSRRKHRDAPTHTTVELTINGQKEKRELDRAAGPAIVSFPLYSPPRISTGSSANGVEVAGVVGVNFGRDPVAIVQQHAATGISITDTTNPYQFAQLLAKIALGMAIATGAAENLVEPSPLAGVILGNDARIGDYVGSMTDELTAYPGELHRIAIFIDERTGYLVADVQLFSSSQSPRYAVVIGRTASAT